MLRSKHLEDVNMTYTEHMNFSLGLSKIFLVASVKAVIHAFIPDVLITSSTDYIKVLKDKMHHRSKL